MRLIVLPTAGFHSHSSSAFAPPGLFSNTPAQMVNPRAPTRSYQSQSSLRNVLQGLVSMKRMRTRTFTLALIALAVGPGLLIFGLVRTSLYGAMVKFLGTTTMLVVAIVLLAALIGVAVFAVVYGFSEDDEAPVRRRRK
jgi:hypothetical protein